MSFSNRDRHVFVKLYKQYIRPHMEFAILVSSLWTQGDNKLMKKFKQEWLLWWLVYKGEITKKNLKSLDYKPLKQDAKDMT